MDQIRTDIANKINPNKKSGLGPGVTPDGGRVGKRI